MDTATLIQDAVIAIAAVGGIFLYLKGHIPQQTIKNLEASNDSYVKLDATRQKNIEALELKVKEIIDNHAAEKLEWTKAIAELQGQIKVYKELPLRELADGIAKVVDISRDNALSNQKILETLQESAATLNTEKRDGGLLVKTNDGTPLEVNVK